MAIRFDEIQLTSDANHLYPTLTNGGGNGLRIQTLTGRGDFGSGNTSYFHISTDRSSFYVGQPVVFDGNISAYSGTETASFAKYFDSQDTSWYGDFNDQSKFNKVNIGGETSSSNWKIYDSYVDAGSSYLQTPQLTVRLDSSATGDIDHGHVQMAIFNRNGANNTWTQLSLASREAENAGNTVSIAGIAAKKTSGTANAWASGDLYLWTKKGASKIINLIADQDGNTSSHGNIYGVYNQNRDGSPVISGFLAEEGVENGPSHFTIPSLSANKFAGINWRGTVTADVDGTSFGLGANPFSVGNNHAGTGSLTANSTTSSIITIVVSGETFTHSSSAGIAFSARAWRAKNVQILTSTDGTNYTSRLTSVDNPSTTTYCTFSTGGTATTHVKYILSNFNTTSTRISNIFAGNYSGDHSQVINKWQEDTKYRSLHIDSYGQTDNEYMVFKEENVQRFRIYENSNNVYFDGGPGYTHFRPRQNGGSGALIISGAPLYVSKIYDQDDSQFYLDPSVYNSHRNSYLWEKSSSTITIKSYGENHLRLNRSGSGYVFALMGDDINENGNNHGQNWEVSFDFNVESGNDSTHFGWAFNYQDENDFYAVIIRDANTVRVQKQVSGVQTYPIAAVSVTNVDGNVIDIDDGWHSCRIQKSKNYIIVEIDGVVQIATIIESSLTYDFGRMGYSLYDNGAEFKNFALRRGAVQQLLLGSGVEPGNSWNGIYDSDNLVLTDGSLTINPHRRGDYGENATTATSTSFNSRLNIWSDSEDHITFGGANTHMVSAWEAWKIWINNDSGSSGTLYLYHKNAKTEFARFSGDGTSSFITGTFSATTFNGNLTGNVTGNVSGSSGSCTGNAATATSATTASNLGGISLTGFYKIQQNAGTYNNLSYHQSTELYPQPAGDMVFGANGTNTGVVACTLRHKIASSYYKNSSGAWQSAINSASYINFNNLLGSNAAHAWSGTDLKRVGADGGLTQDFIMYMGNQQGYSFNGHMLITHSTNGNSFIVSMETTATDPGISEANRVADVGTGGWTNKFTTSTISSWPGYTNYKTRQQVGGSAHAYVRFRFTPTWNSSYTNNINLGHMSMLASYGNFSKSITFNQDGAANFIGGAKFYDSKKLQLGSSNDLEIYHNGTHSYIDNKVGAMYFREQTTDGNMVFAADKGDGGGTYDYFYLDGGSATVDAMGATTAAFVKFGNKTRLDLQSDEATIIKSAGGANGNHPAVTIKSSGTGPEGAAIAIQQQTSEGDTIIFADYEPHVEWGISAENGSNHIHMTAGNSTGNSNLGTKVFKSNAGNNRTAYNKFQFNLTDGKMAIGSSLAIGHLTPNVPLHVKGSGTVARFESTASYSDVIFQNSSGTGGFINFGGTTAFNVYVGGGSAGNLEMSVSNSGTLTVSGDVVAFGSPSDIRLKENIKPIDSALDRIMKLQGVTFDWKDKADTTDREGNPVELQKWKNDVGFIAQDVQKVIPELVRENEDGMLSMRHQGVAPILLEAIKELKAEIEELKKQIK